MDLIDIKVVTDSTKVMHIRLNRPEARNALRNQTLSEIASTLDEAEKNDAVRCVVISGGADFFAAGADIKEMQVLDSISSLENIRATYWKKIREFPKPLLGAVNGYALGGGCELMMHCDIVVAGDNVLIGQPEINLGIIPGAGGTQRLVRTVGKSLAMKMVLSGEFIKADKALESGLVAEVCPRDTTIERTLEIANTIAKKSPLAVRLAKASILSAFEVSLTTGLDLEQRAFAILASSEDREEGINAFLEKRQPKFIGK